MDERKKLLLISLGLQSMLLMLQYTRMRPRRKENEKRSSKRRWWVHPTNRNRDSLGHFKTLFQELKIHPELFFSYTRMSVEMFEHLIEILSPYLKKLSNRENLPPEHRLAIAIRFLATGDKVSTIAQQYRVGKSTAHSIINETCQIIGEVLMPIYLTPPTEVRWKDISNGFYELLHIPNCIGAVGGKHIQTSQAPPNSISINTSAFSTVLLAACDHQYKFTVIDIDAYGSEGDGGVFARSLFSKSIENETLGLPVGKTNLPGSNLEAHHFFVGDESIKMTRHMMKPFSANKLTDSEKVFNDRLSRATRMIECTFGILATRWRVLRKKMNKTVAHTEKVLAACVMLHNFILVEEDNIEIDERKYIPEEFLDFENLPFCAVDGLRPLAASSAHRVANEAYQQRKDLSSWVMDEVGAVSWQMDCV